MYMANLGLAFSFAIEDIDSRVENCIAYEHFDNVPMKSLQMMNLDLVVLLHFYITCF